MTSPAEPHAGGGEGGAVIVRFVAVCVGGADAPRAALDVRHDVLPASNDVPAALERGEVPPPRRVEERPSRAQRVALAVRVPRRRGRAQALGHLRREEVSEGVEQGDWGQGSPARPRRGGRTGHLHRPVRAAPARRGEVPGATCKGGTRVARELVTPSSSRRCWGRAGTPPGEVATAPNSRELSGTAGSRRPQPLPEPLSRARDRALSVATAGNSGKSLPRHAVKMAEDAARMVFCHMSRRRTEVDPALLQEAFHLLHAGREDDAARVAGVSVRTLWRRLAEKDTPTTPPARAIPEPAAPRPDPTPAWCKERGWTWGNGWVEIPGEEHTLPPFIAWARAQGRNPGELVFDAAAGDLPGAPTPTALDVYRLLENPTDLAVLVVDAVELHPPEEVRAVALRRLEAAANIVRAQILDAKVAALRSAAGRAAERPPASPP